MQRRSQIFIELFHHAISFPLGTLGGQGIKVVKFLERLPNQNIILPNVFLVLFGISGIFCFDQVKQTVVENIQTLFIQSN